MKVDLVYPIVCLLAYSVSVKLVKGMRVGPASPETQIHHC